MVLGLSRRAVGLAWGTGVGATVAAGVAVAAAGGPGVAVAAGGVSACVTTTDPVISGCTKHRKVYVPAWSNRHVPCQPAGVGACAAGNPLHAVGCAALKTTLWTTAPAPLGYANVTVEPLGTVTLLSSGSAESTSWNQLRAGADESRAMIAGPAGGVNVGVAVGVADGVAVAVGDGVAVAVGDGVGVAVAPVTTTVPSIPPCAMQ